CDQGNVGGRSGHQVPDRRRRHFDDHGDRRRFGRGHQQAVRGRRLRRQHGERAQPGQQLHGHRGRRRHERRQRNGHRRQRRHHEPDGGRLEHRPVTRNIGTFKVVGNSDKGFAGNVIDSTFTITGNAGGASAVALGTLSASGTVLNSVFNVNGSTGGAA